MSNHTALFNLKYKEEKICLEIVEKYKDSYNTHENKAAIYWENTVTFRMKDLDRKSLEKRIEILKEELSIYKGSLKSSDVTYSESIFFK